MIKHSYMLQLCIYPIKYSQSHVYVRKSIDAFNLVMFSSHDCTEQSQQEDDTSQIVQQDKQDGTQGKQQSRMLI